MKQLTFTRIILAFILLVNFRILQILPNYTDINTNEIEHYKHDIAPETTGRNILIGMAVDCKYDINTIINSLSYNSSSIHVYWYFNVYNAHKPACENKVYPSNSDNIHLVMEPIYKMTFWADYIIPNEIIKLFNVLDFDYVWFVDDDMLLSEFHFEEFIKLTFKLNASISQPSFRSIDNKSQPSSFDVVNDATNKYSNIIAKQTNVIELGAPGFTFDTWKIIHPLIANVFHNYSMCNDTNYGPVSWWCLAAKQFTNRYCTVIHYTPLIHANTRSMNKIGEFEKRGMKCKYYQQEMYSKWFVNHTERNKTLKLFYAKSILPNNINSNIIKDLNKFTLNFNELKQYYPNKIMTIDWLEKQLNEVTNLYIVKFRSNIVTKEVLNYLTIKNRLQTKLNITLLKRKQEILFAIQTLLNLPNSNNTNTLEKQKNVYVELIKKKKYNLTKKQYLLDELKSRKLDTNGQKNELIERLQYDDKKKYNTNTLEKQKNVYVELIKKKKYNLAKKQYLVDELKLRKLDTNGKKNELIERLQYDDKKNKK